MDKFDTDMNRVFTDPGGVNVNALDRLRFAKQVLLGLALICSAVFIAYGLEPDNAGLGHIFELIKIGALPLVTLVISFYFPSSTK